MVEDATLLISIVTTSIVIYNGILYLLGRVHKRQSPLIPIGTVSALYVYPVKSCKGKSVFSMYCDKMGPVSGEVHDRQFIVINGKDGRFYTGRQKPCMVLIECDVRDECLSMTYVDGSSASVNLDEVRRRNDVRTARLFHEEKTDGLDCGDEVSAFLSKILDEPDTRLLMYVKGLFTDRGCVIKRSTWNTEIPLKVHKTPFADDAPFMINTQASLDDLNTRLKDKMTECISGLYNDLRWPTDVSRKWCFLRRASQTTALHTPPERVVACSISIAEICAPGLCKYINLIVVSIERFRPIILIDKCSAWDEDNWLSVHIGEVSLQCLKPCLRCVMTTIHPTNGVKDPRVEPLKTLREFRLAPEGPMRDDCKDNPIFGVDAGIITPGFIHVGETVYVRYKSAYLKPTPFYMS